MDIDVDQKAVNLTYFLFKTPSYRKTTAWLFIISFAFGVLARLSLGKSESLVETFLFGGTDGITLIALPAIVSAMLATVFVSRKQFKQGFKYFTFISLACAILYSLILLLRLTVGKSLFAGIDTSVFVIVANALVLVLWLASTWIALAYKKKSLLLCVIHPLSNLAFAVLWNKFSIIEPSIAIGSPFLAVFKLGVASIILLAAAAALVFIINAPTKRNFGISTIDTVTMFFAQWVSGSKGLEDILAGTGETVTTSAGVITFKTRGRTKAVFAVPQIHYGPIGNLGGSEFPGLLSNALKKETGAPSFIFKGTANHDFDPVYSSDVKVIQDCIEKGISEAEKKQSNNVAFLEGRKGYSHVFGINVNSTAFLTLSRQPQNCEDIHQALGLALSNKLLSKGFQQTILVDRHNCKVDGYLFGPGSKEYIDYEKAIENIEMHRGKLWLGVAESHHVFQMEEGIASGGVKAAVFHVGGKKACFIVADANNCVPEFRNTIVNTVKEKHDFDFIDVLTTDSHAVNSISGIHNPLGEKVNREIFLREAVKTVDQAVKDLSPCTAGASVRNFEIEVLGPQRSSELVITVNSIFAVLKILAPLIFTGSIILAFLALVLIK